MYMYIGCNPLILTIDPSFLGHPSTEFSKVLLPKITPQRQFQAVDGNAGLEKVWGFRQMQDVGVFPFLPFP